MRPAKASCRNPIQLFDRRVSPSRVMSLTAAKDDPDRAAMACVVANPAVASDKETVIFVSTESTRFRKGLFRRHEEAMETSKQSWSPHQQKPDVSFDGGNRP